jgi:hypothetical protein
MQTEKIDPREVYEDKVDRSQWCECNADKACDVCIDDELYGVITTTAQSPAMTEDEAMHALIHCEDEQACTFCNQ